MPTNSQPIFACHNMIIPKSMNKPLLSSRQRGAALIISLIILVVMTIIGTTAIQTTTLEERMVSNMRDRSLAFQMAEMALRDAEEKLLEIISAANLQTRSSKNDAIEDKFNGSATGFVKIDSTDPEIQKVLAKINDTKELFVDEDLWKNSAASHENQDLGDEVGVVSPPRYIVQWIGRHRQQNVIDLNSGAAVVPNCFNPASLNLCIYVFQIFARGTGSSEDSQVILRTHYSLSF